MTIEEFKKKPLVIKTEKAKENLKEPSTWSEQTIKAALEQRTSKRHNPLQSLSISEIDLVKRQISRCWNLAAGAKGAKDLKIAVHVVMNRDGTVRDAKLIDVKRTERDSIFRNAAETALRAVLNPKCHPFKLPPDKYEQWQTIEFNFNPRDMF